MLSYRKKVTTGVLSTSCTEAFNIEFYQVFSEFKDDGNFKSMIVVCNRNA